MGRKQNRNSVPMPSWAFHLLLPKQRPLTLKCRSIVTSAEQMPKRFPFRWWTLSMAGRIRMHQLPFRNSWFGQSGQPLFTKDCVWAPKCFTALKKYFTTATSVLRLVTKVVLHLPFRELKMHWTALSRRFEKPDTNQVVRRRVAMFRSDWIALLRNSTKMGFIIMPNLRGLMARKEQANSRLIIWLIWLPIIRLILLRMALTKMIGKDGCCSPKKSGTNVSLLVMICLLPMLST